MPERPPRVTSRAFATRRSPSLPGLMKVIWPCAATTRSLCELQANAKAESASVKMKPPWAIRCPLTMSGRTVIASVAKPGPISTTSMPRPFEASSSVHIASAQARATSWGDKAALTFTRSSGLNVYARCSAGWQGVSNMVVVHHHPLGRRLGLAGQDKAGLQFPWLQRIVDVHRRLTFHQLRATGRAHAALACERQIDAGAQRGIEDRLVLGHRNVAALAVDDEGRNRLWRRV